LPTLQDRYLALRDQRRPVDYSPDSQVKLPPEERDRYEAVEIPKQLEGQVDGKSVRLQYRLIFVWSESKSRQEATTRERHVAKVVAEFEAVQRNLGRYSLKTTGRIVRRLEVAKGKDPEVTLIEYRLTQDKKGGFHLPREIDAAALYRWSSFRRPLL
jgi:hypothetical protein